MSNAEKAHDQEGTSRPEMVVQGASFKRAYEDENGGEVDT
jgi:hypothetical protein